MSRTGIVFLLLFVVAGVDQATAQSSAQAVTIVVMPRHTLEFADRVVHQEADPTVGVANGIARYTLTSDGPARVSAELVDPGVLHARFSSPQDGRLRPPVSLGTVPRLVMSTALPERAGRPLRVEYRTPLSEAGGSSTRTVKLTLTD